MISVRAVIVKTAAFQYSRRFLAYDLICGYYCGNTTESQSQKPLPDRTSERASRVSGAIYADRRYARTTFRR